MAFYHLSSKIGKRLSACSSVAHAAYYSQSNLKDHRQNITFNYSKIKRDLVHSSILIPLHMPAWTKNRELLWNKVEATEKQKNSSLFRKIKIVLPKELTLEQQINLVQDFTKERFINKGMIADINVHHKKNISHAHIMTTLRRVENGKFGIKDSAWNHKRSLLNCCKNWAKIQNQHLA